MRKGIRMRITDNKRRQVSCALRRKADGGWEVNVPELCDALEIEGDDYDTLDERDYLIWTTLAGLVHRDACAYVGDDFDGGCSRCKGHLLPSDAFCPSCGANVVRREG